MNENDIAIISVLAGIGAISILSFVGWIIYRAFRSRKEARILLKILGVMGGLFAVLGWIMHRQPLEEQGLPWWFACLAAVAGLLLALVAYGARSTTGGAREEHRTGQLEPSSNSADAD